MENGTWKDRLVEEYDELFTRLDKIQDFLEDYENSSNMDMHDWNILIVQKDIMVSYAGILESRMIKHGVMPKVEE